ncbi:MAG TPA: hypothetical protein VJ691_04095 [Vicinamibacterales bacterium]|nr:hypothetical protein [Vicinamibacterales bacterium]
MTAAELAGVMRQILLALGVLFVIVNVRVGSQVISWWRRRARAVVVWPSPKPPFYAINLAIGVLLGILLFVSAYLLRPTASLFGIAMMFVYYGYLLPLSTRIKRGLYEEGIWTDSGFMRYAEIGGLTWRGAGTLVLASRQKTMARRLNVPGVHLGEVRQFLREKIGAHDIEFDAGPGIHLGSRDTRESV